jgi:hypothetical protein
MSLLLNIELKANHMGLPANPAGDSSHTTNTNRDMNSSTVNHGVPPRLVKYIQQSLEGHNARKSRRMSHPRLWVDLAVLLYCHAHLSSRGLSEEWLKGPWHFYC